MGKPGVAWKSLICVLTWNGVMAYFFFVYWYANPDEYPNGRDHPMGKFDCWTGVYPRSDSV